MNINYFWYYCTALKESIKITVCYYYYWWNSDTLCLLNAYYWNVVSTNCKKINCSISRFIILKISCFEIYICLLLFKISYCWIIFEINFEFASLCGEEESGCFPNGGKRSAGIERRNIVYISGDELRTARGGITFFSFSFYCDGFLDVVSSSTKCRDKSRNADPISAVILVWVNSVTSGTFQSSISSCPAAFAKMFVTYLLRNPIDVTSSHKIFHI